MVCACDAPLPWLWLASFCPTWLSGVAAFEAVTVGALGEAELRKQTARIAARIIFYISYEVSVVQRS